jgi:cobalamin biosynthesis Mg chelatase CobN
MDPLTILAAAQTAYGALQAGIAAGKEIQSMAADLSELWGSVAKLTHISAETPRISVFSKKSAEQIAMERYAAKAEAQDLALRAKNMFVGKFGLAAWDQVQREVINIRKEIEKQQWEEERAQAARMEEIKEAGVVFMIVMGTLMVMLAVGAVFLERTN